VTATKPIVLLQLKIACFANQSPKMICIINKLKSSKSPGPDDIGPKLVKENALFLINPLIHLFNTSICTGKVPDKLKLAKVIPVYKEGETHLPGNYRPISLLSVFDKLLEKNYVL